MVPPLADQPSTVPCGDPNCEGQEPAAGERGGLRRLVPVAVLVVIVAGAWVLMESGSDTRTEGFGNGIIEQLGPDQRSRLPQITGRLLDGGEFDSRDLAGKVVVYNLWGSWCGPCREAAPALRRAWEETRRKGVQFVGIDVKPGPCGRVAAWPRGSWARPRTRR